MAHALVLEMGKGKFRGQLIIHVMKTSTFRLTLTDCDVSYFMYLSMSSCAHVALMCGFASTATAFASLDAPFIFIVAAVFFPIAFEAGFRWINLAL